MIKRMVWIAGTFLFTTLLMVQNLSAQEEGYKKYERKGHLEKLIEIGFYDNLIGVRVFDDGRELNVAIENDKIQVAENRVVINDSVIFESDGLHFGSRVIDYNDIADVLITDGDDYTTITLYEYVGNPSKATRMHRGNLQTFNESIDVADDQFIRGIVFSVLGDIEVYGEVNKDVISLFGNVYIGPGAVARGDLGTATGQIDVASDASIYGEAYSSDRDHQRHSYRYKRKAKEVSVSSTFDYNRVDGATPFLGIRFNDNDSLLPSVWANGAYGFESDRWRYDFGVEQTLIRSKPLVIGGSFFRELSSEDDWLLNDGENMAFALLVTEDFKDYYESDGGKVYLDFKPMSSLSLSLGYRYEETKWLNAQPHLWSLFGGDKLFSENFGRVDEPLRSAGIAELDGGTNGSVSFAVEYDTRPEEREVSYSGWHLTSNLEYSSPDLSSDYDFRRYTLTMRRYQKVYDRSMLSMRAMYGGSDGYLPMYKRFYLGGLGTLRGYNHKEFTGNRFWMTNVEYKVAFPKTDLAVSLIWDMAQISNTASFTEENQVYHSLGAAFHIGDSFRINVSRRLDRSFDNDPKVYVRLENKF